MNDPMPSEDILREALKRCPAETIEAAVSYRETRDRSLLPVIVNGVIERFVEPELRPNLRGANDTLRLSEDLGLDSLTIMEIVLLTEEVFHISISAEELRHLCTLGQIKTFIAGKVSAPAPHPVA